MALQPTPLTYVRGLQLGAVQLRQAVDELRSHAGLACGLPYQRVVVGRIAQAEVGAQVDDAIGQRGEAARCGSSRCRAAGRGTADRTSRAPPSARTSACVRLRRLGCVKWTNWPSSRSLVTCCHLEVRMRQRQAQQLAAGVAGGADDRNCERSVTWSVLIGVNPERYADAPSASEIDARCGWSPSGQPLAASQPSRRHRRGRSPPCARGCSRWSARCCCGTPSCS